MPNWCSNRLIVSGDAGLIKDFLKRSEDKEGKFSLNGLVPMPESLHITSGSNVDNARDVINAGNGDWTGVDQKFEYPAWVTSAGIKSDDSLKKKRTKMRNYMKGNLKEEDMKMAQTSFDNEQKYGSKDWYQWSIDNWGTKWDVDATIEQIDEEFIEIEFDSAWAPPVKWLAQVEPMFPELKFQLHYDEPGMGFKGVYSNGSDKCIDY